MVSGGFGFWFIDVENCIVFLTHEHNPQNYKNSVTNPLCNSGEKSKITKSFKNSYM